MLGVYLDIATDRDGLPELFFKGDRHEIIPPSTHQERMEWIRRSYSRFYSQIEERDHLKSKSAKSYSAV